MTGINKNLHSNTYVKLIPFLIYVHNSILLYKGGSSKEKASKRPHFANKKQFCPCEIYCLVRERDRITFQFI